MNNNLTSTSTDSDSSSMPFEELNLDTNAQFPSPDRVYTYTPAELCANLSISRPQQTSSHTITSQNAACQTLLTFPRDLPEDVQKILNSYLSPENTDIEMQSQEQMYDSDDFQNVLRLAQTYDYGVPSPPISEISSGQVDYNYMDEEMSELSMNISDNGS